VALLVLSIHQLLILLEDKIPKDSLVLAVESLVKKGFLEQYTDEHGDFTFAVTESGNRMSQLLEENPELFYEQLMEDLEEEDNE
jgi:DNA-binding MarR family transcriptional regulator